MKIEIKVEVTELFPSEERKSMFFASAVADKESPTIRMDKRYIDEVEFRIVQSIYKRLMRDRDLLINFTKYGNITEGRIEIIPPNCMFNDAIIEEIRRRDNDDRVF